MTPDRADALVVGAGLYGCGLALALKRAGLERVVLVDREPAICMRASFWNQARIHNGYHYPRAFTTAFRSRVNLPRFVSDFAEAVVDITALYAIARTGSKVAPRSFRRFCREIGARLDPAPPALRRLFSPRLVADVFVCEEPVLDGHRLADLLRARLADAGIDVRLGVEVTALDSADGLAAVTADGRIGADRVFNCTYAGLDGLRDGPPLKFEAAEIAILSLPSTFDGVGITVMDGPFFSTLPFPARGLHTLSHVRFTPHMEWTSAETNRSPYAVLADLPREPRAAAMLRDAARFVPKLADATLSDSFFEVKAVRPANEVDDGRPILFEAHPAHPGAWSVLGGKLDTIYDAEAALTRLLQSEVP